MSKVFANAPESIGNTPLITLNRIGSGKATILVKVEGRNPSYSVKCRVGANMIWRAEQMGQLQPGIEIVEPTSGNTGIALAYVAASRGYSLTLTMPETMSLERRKLLAFLGAKLVLTPGNLGMKGAIEKAEEIAASDPGKYYMPQQFSNPANPEIHEKTTGPEIMRDTNGDFDVFISGVGTGGTISGCSRYFKQIVKKNVCTVAVEPSASPVLTQSKRGEPLKPGPHKIQGIGAGFIPSNYDPGVVDVIQTVSNEDAIEYGRRLAREEGILAGISSGAALAAAVQLAERPEFQGTKMVVILPDASERYLSTDLFAGIG
ncbi:MAG: cysteine synthase A [Thermoguttaceae bacterium]